MPVTSRPSLTSRTMPRKSTVAPLRVLLTRSRSCVTSIGASRIAEYMSASRDRRNERDLVASSQLSIARSVLLVYGDHRRRWKSTRLTQCAHLLDDVTHGRAGFDVELEFRASDRVRI